MVYSLKCTELVKEFQLEAYGLKVEIKRAEIMSHFEMANESLKVLESIAEKVKLLSDCSIKAEYELVKAKVLMKLQRILTTDPQNISTFYEAAVCSLEKALKLSIPQCNLIMMREIYYLLSRLCQILGRSTERDQAAFKFLLSDEELRVNSKSTLGFICHFNLQEVIESTLKQIDDFTQKYH